MKYSLTIVGGYGAMGIWLLNFLEEKSLLNSKLKVTITGPNEIKGQKIAKQFNVEYKKDNIEATKEADITIISVPIEITEKTIKEIGSNLKPDSLLVDLTSVKTPIIEAMNKFVKDDVKKISIHPMFGPRVVGLEGQVVLFVDVNGGRWKNKVLKFLEDQKTKVIQTDIKSHDQTLAVVQCLTHFAYISIGATLKDMNLDIKESRNFSSPIYELMLDLVGRIIGQNPKLYADIQMFNPYAHNTHENFLKNAKELNKAVKEKDHQKFERIMSEAGKHFDDVNSALEKSDKAIEVLNRELKHLKESIGKEIALKHRYTDNIHFGKVEDIQKDYVILKQDHNKKIKVKISNVSILDEKETDRVKKEIKKTVYRDFSYVFDKNLDENILAELIEREDKNILNSKVIDVFSGSNIPKDKKSITIRVEFLNEDIKTHENNVKKILEGLCGKIRS